jgi:multidrug efflux system outer membrane protein
MISKRAYFCFLLFFSLLTSCHVGPDYNPPCPLIPEEWKAPTYADIPTVREEFWWEVFGDPLLNSLELEAIQNSPNLFVAFERIIEARAQAGIVGADLYPQFNLNPNYLNQETLIKIPIPLSTIPIPGLNIGPNIRFHQITYTLPLAMNYEVDLWGKYRDQYDAALYNAAGQEEAYRTALLTLTTDLASSFYALRSLDAQIDFLTDIIKLFQKNYDLNQLRYKKGVANELDVAEAEVQLKNSESNLFDVQRMRTLQENMIAALMGIPASDFHLDHNPLKDPPPPVPASLPSEVLLQRPDVAQAEFNMASENALVGAAYASFFPSLSLTGALGYSSPDLKNFLTWKSRLWSMGASIVQTIFDGFRKYYDLEAEKARYQEAVGNYLQTVVTAFQEVEDALNNIEYQAKEYKSLEASVKAAKKATHIANQRYRQGLVNYFEVVQIQTTEVQTETNQINVLGSQYQSTIQLIKALGGQW